MENFNVFPDVYDVSQVSHRNAEQLFDLYSIKCSCFGSEKNTSQHNSYVNHLYSQRHMIVL